MKSIQKSAGLLLVLITICFSFAGCAKKCEKCSGSGNVECTFCENGKMECTNCSGKKHEACAECDGKGEVLTNERCHHCSDSKRPGYEYDSIEAIKDLYYGIKDYSNGEKYWSECIWCDGKGYRSKECTKCSGSGLGEICKSCSGTGTITCTHCEGTLSVTCPECEGKGKIRQTEKSN